MPPLLLESCEDEEFQILINSAGRTEPCSWIDADPTDVDFRRREQCSLAVKADIKAACKRACGECCGDNPDFQYKYDHLTLGPIIIDCTYVGFNEERKSELCPLLQQSCPGACGLCPSTESPTASPSKSPTPIPSPFEEEEVPELAGATAEVDDESDKESVLSTKVTTLHFAAEIYTKDDSIKSVSSVDILNGVNTFLEGEMEGYENHKMFTSLANAGIDNIFFTFLALNAPFGEHKSKFHGIEILSN